MNKIPVILDGDPGHDDAIAWMIAAASPELEIMAVTTAAGNKDIDNVTENAAKLCALFHIKAPLSKGAPGPLVAAGITAGDFHGKTGLDGAELPVRGVQLSALSAAEQMARVLELSEEPVVIISTGAETNLAALLLYRPDLKKKIRAFYVMGGGIETGNWNPAAEFNILVDPEAARIVFESGIPIVMCGLDVTERALIYPNEIEEIRAMGTPLANIVACWLDFFGRTHAAMGYTGWPLHDPCAVLSLTDPGMFTMKPAFIQIDTSGALTRGATLADYEDESHFNGKTVLDVNRTAFIEKLKAVIRSYGDLWGMADDDAECSAAPNAGAKKHIADAPGDLVEVLPSDTPDTLCSKILRSAPCSLLLLDGAETAALAFKVRPYLAQYTDKFIYAGGTLERGDATAWAEASVYRSPEAVEALLNSGVPVVFATLEAAKKYGTTAKALARDYAGEPSRFQTLHCGIHVEFQTAGPARGKLICDRNSDNRFEKPNAYLLL